MRRALGTSLALVMLAACARDDSKARVDSTAATPTGVATTRAPVESGPPLASLGESPEATVQGVVDAINAADVRLATFGAQKGTHADVKRFAGDVGSTHRQKVTDRSITANATGPASAVTAPLRDAASTAADRLVQLAPGPAFDRAWADAEVDVHERALAVIDRVASAPSKGDLAALLAQTRAQVQRHLDEARALQTRLR